MSKKLYVAIFIFFVSISHVIIPLWNGGKDFLFLATWQIFASNGNLPVSDLVFENSEKFLFRDDRKAAKQSGIETYFLYTLTVYGNRETIQEKFGPQLKKYCGCSKIYRVRLKGTLVEHIYDKKPLEEISREEI